MKFSLVAEYFEKIEKASSRLKMTDLIAELFARTGKEDIDKLVYLCQGQLGASYENLEVGLGEKFIVQAIAKIAGYSKEEVNKLYKEKGDLGLVAEEALLKKKQASLFSEELTVAKVFNNFLKIVHASGTGSQELKIKLLAELLNSAKPREARYLVRIPLGKLRLGSGDPTLMDALALNYLQEFKKKEKKLLKEFRGKYKKEEDIERQMKFKLREKIESYYNIHSDLGRIAKLLKENSLKGLEKIKIEAGVPIRPTLAERLPTTKEIVEKIGKCLVEPKMDGFRLQCHFDGNKVWIFSRNQEEMTHMFPDIVEAIRKQVKVKEVIFEGEAITFNEETGQFYPFQITMQRKRKYDVKDFAKKYPLKLFVFDVMMVNGKNLMALSLQKRREGLKKLVKKGTVISLPESIVTDNPERIDTFFDENIEDGLEGIIAKDLNAPYIAGARKFAWIKLKRSYKGELTDTLDVLILGYFSGRGHRTQFGLGALLVGVYNKGKDRFESIAKIGTGLTEEQLTEMNKILGKIVVKKKPAVYESELEPDYWVEPCYVIEVIADEITKSPVHTCAKEKGKEGLALRFPRMVKMRVDKKPEQATSIKEVKQMFEKQRQVKKGKGK